MDVDLRLTGITKYKSLYFIWKSNLLVSFSVDSINHLCLNQLGSLKRTPSSSSLFSNVNRKLTGTY